MGNLVLALFLFIQFTFGTSQLSIHESREGAPEQAIDRRRIEPDTWLPMRIGLRPNNDALRDAESYLMDVSDPESTNFGRHWTQKDVINAFRPSEETFSTVVNWLLQNNITHATHTDNKQWLAFELPARQAEELLHTQYFEHMNRRTGRFEASTDQYYLPEDLREHIDLIMPAVTAKDITGRSERSRQYFRELSARKDARDAASTVRKTSTLQTRTATTTVLPSGFPSCAPNDLKCCDIVVSPACIRALYNIPKTDLSQPVSPNNTMGFFELYSLTTQKDRNEFFYYYTDIPNGTAPIFKSIDGAVTDLAEIKDFRHEYLGDGGIYYALGEAELDTQIAFPLVYPQNITVFQENDPYWAHYEWDYFQNVSLFNSFFDALDGSLCNFTACGISNYDPEFDPVYPDTHNFPDPWRKKVECGVFKPTNVISISYGTNEFDISFNYQKRQCLEFLKLGLQGTSIFVSSGDSGPGPCVEPNKTTILNYKKNGIFNPGEPVGCPWMTVVGATQIHPGSSVSAPEYGALFSGGGFSNIFPRPKYQDDAVTTYFKKHSPDIPYYQNGDWQNGTGKYNRDGRGYPDVAASGVEVAFIDHGTFQDGLGTSASTPIVAAVINRIVEERIKAGKGALGFINPTLYKNPGALNDIVSTIKGSNKAGYCSEGFSCVPGWDPVTGYGTPDYQKLLDIFLKLP